MWHVIKISNCKDIYKDIDMIRQFLADLIYEYPSHDVWFEAVASEIIKGIKKEREMLYIKKNDEIVGVSILKNTNLEKKICTLRVAEKYQKQGIGTILLEKSCEYLGTNKPIITVSQSKHTDFVKILQKFHFTLEHVYFGKYKEMSIEFCYNGILLPESILKSKTVDNIHDQPSLIA